MKIYETRNSIAELVSQYKVSNGKEGVEPEKEFSGFVTEEKVSLSSGARDFQQAQQALEALPDVREDKVRELKDQIEGQRYTVNGDKVAEKMVRESLLDIMV